MRGLGREGSPAASRLPLSCGVRRCAAVRCAAGSALQPVACVLPEHLLPSHAAAVSPAAGPSQEAPLAAAVPQRKSKAQRMFLDVEAELR